MEKAAVVICTHNRQKELIGCLESLRKFSPKGTGIVVIDSSDKALPARYRKLIHEYIHDKKKKPLSEKRNLAIKKIDTDIMIFTDDDCIITKEWIPELLKSFDKGAVCVTGRTIPYKGYEKTWYEKKFSFSKLGQKKRIIKKHLGLQNLWRFGHGNNMAFDTKIFDKIGLFDTNLGVGSKGLRAEDVDIFYRIYKNRYKIAYNPKAVIFHKHLVEEKQLPWQAYANSYASHLVLFKNKDINTMILFLGGIIKLFLKMVFSTGFNKTVNICLFRGWVGSKRQRAIR